MDMFDEIHAEVQAAKNPTHPAGKVTAYDHDTGLPIVKRPGTAESTKPLQKEAGNKAEMKPAPRDATETKEKAAAEIKALQPAVMGKDTPVQLKDGSRGRIAFTDGKNARVKTDDGKNVQAKHHELTPLKEVKVAAHTRLLPGKQ